jgi:hypothetical protein
MTTTVVTDYLKYANLQMAAESLNLSDGLTGLSLADALTIESIKGVSFAKFLVKPILTPSARVVEGVAGGGAGEVFASQEVR